MIALRNDCLLFQLHNGESIPCTAQMITVDIVGEAQSPLDQEMLQHAAGSVFHYFKAELERETVTIGEFSHALEKVLQHLGYTIHAHSTDPNISESDLGLLACETSDNLELLFFSRLRDELRLRLQQSPRVLHFHGLRGCVKRIAGARRWSPRCEELQDQIISFLRECLSAEAEQNKCALVVE